MCKWPHPKPQVQIQAQYRSYDNLGMPIPTSQPNSKTPARHRLLQASPYAHGCTCGTTASPSSDQLVLPGPSFNARWQLALALASLARRFGVLCVLSHLGNGFINGRAKQGMAWLSLLARERTSGESSMSTHLAAQQPELAQLVTAPWPIVGIRVQPCSRLAIPAFLLSSDESQTRLFLRRGT